MIPTVEDHSDDSAASSGPNPLNDPFEVDPFAEDDLNQKIPATVLPSSSSLGATKNEILEFLTTLPRNLHWEKQQKKAAASQNEGNSSDRELMETLEENEEEEEEDEDDADEGSGKHEEGLKIAWQYRKSVQRARLGHDNKSSTRSSASDNTFCHSYDLSGRLSEQFEEREGHPKLKDFTHLNNLQCCDDERSCRSGRTCGFRLYQRLLTHLVTFMADKQQPRTVVRLLLYHYKPEVLCVALPLLLTQIRVKQLPVVVMVSMQPWKSTTANPSKALLSLQRASDVVLQTEGFAARSHYPPPPEFRHLHGLLLIRKVSTVTSATSIGGGHYADLTMSKRPPANIYGLKRDRRKLHIPLLHIPPEDHAEGGGSVGGGGVRSGAGRPASGSKPSASGSGGCGSANQNSKLDF